MSTRFLTPFQEDKSSENQSVPEFHEDIEDADLRSQLTQKITIDDGIFDRFDKLIKSGELSKQIDKEVYKLK